jgi:hypothetical protein
VEIRIIHPEPSVASGEVKPYGLVVPEQATMAKIKAIDGKGEELLDRSLPGYSARSLGKVAGAVGIKSNVNDGLIEDKLLKSQFRTEQRADFQAGDDAIGMSERDIGSGFAAADSNIPDFDLKPKWNGMEATDLGAAPGYPFDLGGQAMTDERLKRLSGGIEKQSRDTEKCCSHEGDQIFPPAARWLGSVRRHCD